jgi:hypothetical protein
LRVSSVRLRKINLMQVNTAYFQDSFQVFIKTILSLDLFYSVNTHYDTNSRKMDKWEQRFGFCLTDSCQETRSPTLITLETMLLLILTTIGIKYYIDHQ